MVYKIGRIWPYSRCFVGCRFHDLFRIARRILVQFPSNFFYIRLIRVEVVQPCSSTDSTTAWKKSHFIISERSDFHRMDNFSRTCYAFSCSWLWNQISWRNLWTIVLPRDFFAQTPSIIRRIVGILKVVDWLLRNTFFSEEISQLPVGYN